MKQLHKFIFLSFLLSFTYHTQAQLTINSGITAADIINTLQGNGVQISNVTINCNSSAYGDFDNDDASLPLSEGIILSTGNANQAAGPSSSNPSTNNGTAGDTQLNALLSAQMGTSMVTNDACTIEFDFIPAGSSLNFVFTFASEEYEEYVCSNFNDAFAFYITGPDPAGGTFTDKNLAVTPCGGSSCAPVTINTINHGSGGTAPNCDFTNTAYYQNNGGNPTLAYDGYTINLVASTPVVPCQSYHLVLKIADGTDSILDSAVFIESLASGTVLSGSSISSDNIPNPLEGCVDALITIQKDPLAQGTLTFDLFYGGSATPFYDPSPDYMVLDASTYAPYTATSITLSNTQPVKQLLIRPIDDGISDNLENVTLTVKPPSCPGLANDTLAFFDITILDEYPAIELDSDTLVFCGETINLEANDADYYEWIEEGVIVKDGFDFPPTADEKRQFEITSITDTTHYKLRIRAGLSCWIEKDFVVIPGYIEVEEDLIEICPGQDTLLVAYGNETYEWIDEDGNVLSTADTCLVNPSVNTVYTVTGDNRGCINSTTVTIQIIQDAELDIPALEEWYCSTSTTPVILGGSPAGGDFVIEGLSNSIVLNSMGVPITFVPSTDLPEGDYQITYNYAHPTLGCLASYTTTFLVAPSNPEFQNLPSEICSTGNPLDLADYIFSPEGLPIGTFRVNDPNGTPVTSFEPSIYTIGTTQTIYYNDGCAEITATIDIVSGTVVNEPVGLEICSNSGELLQIDAGVDAVSYSWYEEDIPAIILSIDRVLEVEEKGVYWVTIENELGCISQGKFEVGEGCDPKFFIPTAFSPNGDGVNDEFQIFGQDFTDFKIQIFNRWGEVVFFTEDYRETWDGTYRGNLVPQGSYTCIYQYRNLPNGELKEERSNLLIVK